MFFVDEDLFFLEITCFRPKKPLEFAISAGKSLAISVKTFFFCFFFGDHLVFGRKIPCNFSKDLFLFLIFLEITYLWPEKLLDFAISAGKSF